MMNKNDCRNKDTTTLPPPSSTTTTITRSKIHNSTSNVVGVKQQRDHRSTTTTTPTTQTTMRGAACASILFLAAIALWASTAMMVAADEDAGTLTETTTATGGGIDVGNGEPDDETLNDDCSYCQRVLYSTFIWYQNAGPSVRLLRHRLKHMCKRYTPYKRHCLSTLVPKLEIIAEGMRVASTGGRYKQITTCKFLKECDKDQSPLDPIEMAELRQMALASNITGGSSSGAESSTTTTT